MNTIKNTIVQLHSKNNFWGVFENNVIVVPIIHLSQLEAFEEYYYYISGYYSGEYDDDFIQYQKLFFLSLMDLPKLSD